MGLKKGIVSDRVWIYISKTVYGDIRFSVVSVKDGFISVFMVVAFSE